MANEINRSLIVVHDDGNIYEVPEDVYKKYPIKDKKNEGMAREMVKFGASFGFMPVSGPGIGTACYLVNLRSLRTVVPSFPERIKSETIETPTQTIKSELKTE